MPLWTDQTMTVAREGMIAEQTNPQVILSKIAEGDIRVGLLLETGTNANQISPLAVLPAADAVSVVLTPIASAAAAQEVGPAAFDGVAYGDGLIGLAQRLRFTFNASADWVASVMQVRGEGAGGAEYVEDILIPAGGGAVVDTQGVFSLVQTIAIPAQGGVAGTLTVGTAPTAYVPDPRAYIGVGVYDRMAYPSATATVTVDDEQPVAVMTKGRIWVRTEDTVVAGAPAYVRMVTAGAAVRGQWRGSPAANFARYPGAHFVTATSGGLAVLELGR